VCLFSSGTIFKPKRKEVSMDATEKILRALGRIEGELVEIRRLSERVRKLEVWQAWLRGGWAALVVLLVLLSGLAGR
jgi:hypothetical protein